VNANPTSRDWDAPVEAAPDSNALRLELWRSTLEACASAHPDVPELLRLADTLRRGGLPGLALELERRAGSLVDVSLPRLMASTEPPPTQQTWWEKLSSRLGLESEPSEPVEPRIY
jgi:hypothetical protein